MENLIVIGKVSENDYDMFIYHNPINNEYFYKDAFSNVYSAMSEKEVCCFYIGFDEYESFSQELYQQKFLCVKTFIIYDGIYYTSYGHADSSEEAIKLCEERCIYFKNIFNQNFNT